MAREAAKSNVAAANTRVIVLDAGRRLVRASDAGLAFLAQRTALHVALDRVQGLTQLDDDRLARAVSEVLHDGHGEVAVPIGPRGLGLSLALIALQGLTEESEVLLIVRDAKDERRKALVRAAAFFGLTCAESRLLSALFEGCSVPDAASRLGVAPTTARSHLQSVFAKTGVRRQGDLVNLVSGLATAA
jgi:DNA-binding NarL/FixJ family response regulator